MEEPVLNRKGLMTTVVSVGVFSFILAGCGAGAGTGTTTADIQNETTLEASASVQSATASEASASAHTYVLETLGYHKAHAVKDNESKKAVSIFAAREKQKYNDKNGEEKMLDTTWIFYDDMTFEQFVMKDDNVETFSKGTYAFENGGDFIYEDGEKNNGKITINCNERYEDGKGLTGHSSTNTYELNTLELDQLYVSEK